MLRRPIYFVLGNHDYYFGSIDKVRKAVKQLCQERPNLHYLPGEHLLGDDAEGTVDSSHPTDLGFLRQAEAFAKVLRPLVAE